MSFIVRGRRPSGFKLLIELAPGKQDAAFASLTHEANIRADANDFPFIGPTRVLFAKANDVADLDIYEHKSRLYHA